MGPPPKTKSRGGKAGRGGATTAARRSAPPPARPTTSSKKGLLVNSIEDDEVYDDQDGEAEDDDSPVSTADLQAILKAFGKAKSKKESASAKALEKQLDALVKTTQERVAGAKAASCVRCDEIINSLSLDHPGDLGPGYAFFLPLIETDAIDATASALDEHLAALDPSRTDFYTDSKKALDLFRKRGRKAHKQFKKAVTAHLEEQLEMAEFNARRGPLIAKHVKGLAVA